MRSIKNAVSGPEIQNGDLIVLDFGTSQLRMRLPSIPKNRDHFDNVSHIRDFSIENTSSWRPVVNNSKLLYFSDQCWKYESRLNYDDIASYILRVSILEVSAERQSSGCLLKSNLFRQAMIEDLACDYEDHRHFFERDSNWPFIDNEFHTRYLDREPMPWIFSHIGSYDGKDYYPLAHIPLGSRFVFCASTEMCSLHYSDRKNPFTEQELKQFEFEIFDDFLNQISVTYSEETLALIQKLNAESCMDDQA